MTKQLCPSGNQAIYCCQEPTCEQPTLKCMRNCQQCIKLHAKCPRQIKVHDILEKAQKIKEKASFNKVQVKGEDLITPLIKQLEGIRKQLINLKIHEWGFEQNLRQFIFEQQINFTGKWISSTLSKDPIYPDPRYFLPSQLRQDIEQVKKVNLQLGERTNALYQCYKQLSQCDCMIQVFKAHLNEEHYAMIQHNDLEDLHNKLKEAIKTRLSINRMFVGVEQKSTDEELFDFRSIGKKLFDITFTVLKQLMKNKDYGNVIKFKELNLCLFQKQREEFAIEQDQQFQYMIQKMNEIEAFANYHLKNYRLAYDYWKPIDKTTMSEEVLKIMVEICKAENLRDDLLLCLLQLQSLTKDNNNLLSLLFEIVEIYETLKDENKMFEYYKKINQIVQPKSLNPFNFIKWINRCLFMAEYRSKENNYFDTLNILKSCIDGIREYSQKNLEIAELDLKVRYYFHLIQRVNMEQNLQSATEVSKKQCSEHLAKIKTYTDKDKPELEPIFKIILKKYLYKFSILQSQHMKDQDKKLQILKQAYKLAEQLNLKVFEPVFEIAKISFESKSADCLSWLNKSNNIYPTFVCYQYEGLQYFRLALEKSDKSKQYLQSALKSLNKSLALFPLQKDLIFLKGIIYQNLGQYQNSNNFFNTVLKSYENSNEYFQILGRIAENNELILKSEANTLSEDQKISLLGEAKKLYKECISSNSSIKKWKLGYARVLKSLGQRQEAQRLFKELTNSDYNYQAYIFLGELKEEKAKQNEEYDFDLLEEALEFYKKAGKIAQNKKNIVRIYRYLDQEQKALEVEADNDWK